MAVVGIVMKFFQIVISIVVGMAAGCIPVVGFNMGAKKPARVKELFTKLLLAEAAVGVVALVLVEGFPRQLIALFGDHSGLCQQGLLHLFAGHGQGSGIHRPVHGA
ncbi:multidrug efflux pump VmrA [uncultured Clostridium sp.]|nr:multidrug efflux pump VmrA [uncultured Clostridium sp.]